MGDQITKTIIVEAPVEEVYAVWANFENFPHFMENIEEVRNTGERTSHWVMTGPLKTRLEWDAVTTRREENKRIGWNTKDLEGDVTTSGQVTFNNLPQNQTEVTVTVHYEPNKAGLAGEVVDALFARPEEKLEEDLRNFKEYIEGFERRVESS